MKKRMKNRFNRKKLAELELFNWTSLDYNDKTKKNII